MQQIPDSAKDLFNQVIHQITSECGFLKHQKSHLVLEKNQVFFEAMKYDDRECLQITRFDVQELEELTCLAYEIDPLNLPIAIKTELPEPHCKFSRYEKVVIFMTIMATNTASTLLRYVFGCVPSVIHNVFIEILHRLHQSLLKHDEWTCFRPYSDEELRNWQSTNGLNSLEDCVYIVDATYVEIARPDRERKSLFFSDYKKMHAWCFEAVIDRAGRIRWIQAALPGSMSEKTLFVEEVIPRIFQSGKPIHGLKIMGDSLYNSLDYCTAPYDKGDFKSTTLINQCVMKNWNRFIASRRILVEHVFGRLKGDFPVFSQRWRYDLELVPVAFVTACCLTNYLRVKRHRWAAAAIEIGHDMNDCPLPDVNRVWPIDEDQYDENGDLVVEVPPVSPADQEMDE